MELKIKYSAESSSEVIALENLVKAAFKNISSLSSTLRGSCNKNPFHSMMMLDIEDQFDRIGTLYVGKLHHIRTGEKKKEYVEKPVPTITASYVLSKEEIEKYGFDEYQVTYETKPGFIFMMEK